MERNMKKYIVLALVALLMVACSDDDDNNEIKTLSPIEQVDLSGLIDKGYSTMIRLYPYPTMNFGGFYLYQQENSNIESFSVVLDTETQVIYNVMESLAPNAFTAQELQEHFSKTLDSYGSQPYTDYDENGNEMPTTQYLFGKTNSDGDTILVVTITGNTSINYVNPQNVPVEPETPGLEEATPIDVVNMFMGQDIEDILDEYEDVFFAMGNMYMAFMEENEMLSGFALTVEDGIVNSIILLYNGEDEEVINYYTEEGYFCMPMGENEDGDQTYIMLNGNILINYAAGRGVVTYFNDDDED